MSDLERSQNKTEPEKEQRTISQIVVNLATEEDDHRAFVQTSLLNTFISARQLLGGDANLSVEDFRAYGRAAKELDAVCLPREDGKLYAPPTAPRFVKSR